jgi:SAM-dependent methyltransferase
LRKTAERGDPEGANMTVTEGFSSLTSKDFATIFGLLEEEMPRDCLDLVENSDFRYCRFTGEKQDQLILKILKLLDSEDFSQAGTGRHAAWEKGWSENLKELVDSNYDLTSLVPKYFDKHGPLRLKSSYIMPADTDFLFNITKLFRNWLFQRYFYEYDIIYEFGCGTAFHLAYLAELYPGKKLFGFDWAKTSQEIIHHLSLHYGWSIQGRFFDFFNPDDSIEIDPRGIVYTFAALEQLGNNYGKFLDFILKKSPKLCINVECFNDLYEEGSLFDYLALRYQKKRNYLYGYLSTLNELQSAGRIEIIKIHRQLYGNLFFDPHSYVIWRPVSD